MIEPDGLDVWDELPQPMTDYKARSHADLRERIRWAGIVGLGGAAFPTAVKVNVGGRRAIDTLVINAAECEPYITCDDVLMRERAPEIIEGIGILRHLTGARECLIGIEDNKPEAAEALREAISASGDREIEVVVLPTLYPSGGEKQLIRLLTGREVPSHGLPAAIGVLCQNVATAAAVADAVLRGRPCRPDRHRHRPGRAATGELPRRPGHAGRLRDRAVRRLQRQGRRTAARRAR